MSEFNQKSVLLKGVDRNKLNIFLKSQAETKIKILDLTDKSMKIPSDKTVIDFMSSVLNIVAKENNLQITTDSNLKKITIINNNKVSDLNKVIYKCLLQQINIKFNNDYDISRFVFKSIILDKENGNITVSV